MARRVKIQWNIEAFAEIRRSPEAVAALQGEVDKILSKVGTENYAGDVRDGKTRARGGVVTTTARAMRGEHKDHRLLRAAGGS